MDTNEADLGSSIIPRSANYYRKSMSKQRQRNPISSENGLVSLSDSQMHNNLNYFGRTLNQRRKKTVRSMV